MGIGRRIMAIGTSLPQVPTKAEPAKGVACAEAGNPRRFWELAGPNPRTRKLAAPQNPATTAPQHRRSDAQPSVLRSVGKSPLSLRDLGRQPPQAVQSALIGARALRARPRSLHQAIS